MLSNNRNNSKLLRTLVCFMAFCYILVWCSRESEQFKVAQHVCLCCVFLFYVGVVLSKNRNNSSLLRTLVCCVSFVLFCYGALRESESFKVAPHACLCCLILCHLVEVQPWSKKKSVSKNDRRRGHRECWRGPNAMQRLACLHPHCPLEAALPALRKVPKVQV